MPGYVRPRLRHPGAARRRRARPRHRRARGADPPDHLVRVRVAATTPRRCSTWSARATSTPHQQPDQRGARGARGRARRRHRRDRHGQRPGGAAPGDRHPDGRRLAHRRHRSALYGGSHNLLHYTLRALRHRDHLRQAGRHRRLARRDPARDQAAVRRDARQPRPRRARHPDRRGDRARARPAAAGRLDLHHALADEAVRPRRRPASTTRPPSSCRATAP